MKKILRTTALLLVLAIFAFGVYLVALAKRNDSSCVPSETVQVSELEIASQLQTVLDDYSATNGNVGLQATVILPDGTVWDGASGYANDVKACQMTLTHNNYIGSITKTFTASLVMEQVEAGTLRLGDPLSKWSEHPDGDRITVEMLLRHTSGIPNYTENGTFLLTYFGRPQKEWMPAELFAVIQDQPLKFEPGFKYEYSNANFIALGMILEEVTGQPYGELLREAANKIGAEHIYYPAYPASLVIANGYDETVFNLGKRNLTAFRTSMESGAFSAGGIAGSAHDVALFFHTLFTNAWLDAETVAQMMDAMDAPDEDLPLQVGYGLGVRNFVIDGESLYGHSGTIPGYSGVSLHNPDYGYTITVLSNVSTIDQMTIYGDLQAVVLVYFDD